jgi:hypothetical protein
MESVSNVRSKQRAVIEFLLAENESITNIQRRLTNVCGNMAMDKSTVSFWGKLLASSEQGQGNVSDLPCSGRPKTAVSLQQYNGLTVIFETTGESQAGNSPLYLVLVSEASTKSFTS